MDLSDLADMSSGDDSLRTAVLTAKEQALAPLIEESSESLELDLEQARAMDLFLNRAWFFGIRTGHKVMLETKMGQEGDATAVLASMEGEFQEIMEGLAEGLNLTVTGTLNAWNFLGEAWLLGAKFWEVEIAARLIERTSGDPEEGLRQLENE
jgi:hypothetical protein